MNNVVKLPGKAEAEAIAADYQAAVGGVLAWVRVGLRMIDVKERAGKGQFTKWVEDNLVSHVIPMQRAHLFRAKAVAEHLASQHHISPEHVLTVCEDEGHPLWEDVLGKSTRQLSLEVKEYRALTEQEELDEKEAKEACEAIWKDDPEKRDRWEPKVLTGEQSYREAYGKMTESDTYTGKARGNTRSDAHLLRAVGSFQRYIADFSKLKANQQQAILLKQKEALGKAPLEYLKPLASHLDDLLREAIRNKKGGSSES